MLGIMEYNLNDVTYSFAKDSQGNIVKIENAEKGTSYFCCDKHCNSEMIPRQGKVNRWHYAHKNNEKDGCKESIIHLLTKESIQQLKYVRINSTVLSNEIIHIPLHNIQIEKSCNGFIPDIQAEIINHRVLGTCKVWIEIINTSDFSKEKQNYIASNKDLLVIKHNVFGIYTEEKTKNDIDNGKYTYFVGNAKYQTLKEEIKYNDLVYKSKTNYLFDGFKEKVLIESKTKNIESENKLDLVANEISKFIDKIRLLNINNNSRIYFDLVDTYKDIRLLKKFYQNFQTKGFYTSLNINIIDYIFSNLATTLTYFHKKMVNTEMVKYVDTKESKQEQYVINKPQSKQEVDGIELRFEYVGIQASNTKEYILSTQDAYWKWNLYQLPLNDFQISRNFHRAKEFYKGHVNLMEQWEKDFIHNTKLDKKQILFFERLA